MSSHLKLDTTVDLIHIGARLPSILTYICAKGLIPVFPLCEVRIQDSSDERGIEYVATLNTCDALILDTLLHLIGTRSICIGING